MKEVSDTNKSLRISSIQNKIGWAYHDMNWLNATESKRITREIESRITRICASADLSYSKTKLHIGPLSPGCRSCAEGTWSCIYFTNLCSAQCFFCPQIVPNHDLPPTTEGIFFQRPEDYAAFIELCGYHGVGFSGGDPIIIIKKLIPYIRAVKNIQPKAPYVWIYTNGKLINKDILKKLKLAGVDEIRFDIAANNYNLRPLALAKEYFDTVTVEIPAIPEDLPNLLSIIPKLEHLQIRHMNLHELMTTPANYKEFICRNYTFLHHPYCGVLDSIISALDIMEFAIQHNSTIPINFCSNEYKLKVQNRGQRTTFCRLASTGADEITEAGYIRSLSMLSVASTSQQIANFKKERRKKRFWFLDKSSDELYFNSTMLNSIDVDPDRPCFYISYFSPSPSEHPQRAREQFQIELNDDKRIFMAKVLENKFGPISLNALKRVLSSIELSHKCSDHGNASTICNAVWPYERPDSGMDELF